MLLDPSPELFQLRTGWFACEVERLHEDGIFASNWFVLPDEIDKILGRVDELGFLLLQFQVETSSLPMFDHAGIYANPGLVNSIDEPDLPIVGSTGIALSNHTPVSVSLFIGLGPITRVD